MKFWRFKKKWIEAVLAFAMTAVLAGFCDDGSACRMCMAGDGNIGRRRSAD